MDYYQTIKSALTKTVAQLTPSGITVPDFSLSHPADPSHGDFATNVALLLFPQVKNETEYKSPRALAEVLKDKLTADRELMGVIERVEVAGAGFVNFFIKSQFLAQELEHITVKQDQYGSSDLGQGRRWLIEHTSPNPNKAMHLGHLRNNVTGMAIGRIAKFSGYEIIFDCVDNNRGIAIAKLMWGYLKFAHKGTQEQTDIQYWSKHQDEWMAPEQAHMRPDRFMDELYVKASEDFANPEVETKVRQMVVDWEAEDKLTWELWKKVLEYVYQGQRMTLDRLGSHWDHIWHEHEHYKLGKDIVKAGLEKGVFKVGEKGAIVTDLAACKLPDTVVIKSDGTALYITQDLALTKLKFDTFHPQKAFWVIGPEQSLAMQQTFCVCDQLGIANKADCIHVAYGYMSIKGQGKMSSRAGNVVYIDDLLDMAKQGVKDIMQGSTFTPEELETISEEVGVGAVKYAILRMGRMIDVSFDLKSSISLNGNSGPYIQYTYARCKSVLEKSQISNLKSQNDQQKEVFQTHNSQPTTHNQEELALLRYLYRFPEVVAQSATELAPHHISTYLYELSQRFNSFYNKHSILGKGFRLEVTGDGLQPGSENLPPNTYHLTPTIAFRLMLTQATSVVLKNGLQLLGIAAPERM